MLLSSIWAVFLDQVLSIKAGDLYVFPAPLSRLWHIWFDSLRIIMKKLLSCVQLSSYRKYGNCCRLHFIKFKSQAFFILHYFYLFALCARPSWVEGLKTAEKTHISVYKNRPFWGMQVYFLGQVNLSFY